MYEHLSKPVEQAIKLANQIAHEYEQEYVGTEHILLAILEEGSGLGPQILARHGLSKAKVKAEIDKLLKASLEDTWVFGRLPGSPHFRNVIATAIEEARELGSDEVRGEHLILALLVEKGCTAQTALKTLGLTPKLVRDEIRNAGQASSSK